MRLGRGGGTVTRDGTHSGDLGDFASFVTHMKQLADVSLVFGRNHAAN